MIGPWCGACVVGLSARTLEALPSPGKKYKRPPVPDAFPSFLFFFTIPILFTPSITLYPHLYPLTNHSIQSKMSLAGKTVLITGGVKNLGALTAREIAPLGNPNFVLHYHSESDKATGEALVKELAGLGSKAIIVQGALHKPADNVKLFDAAIAAFGGVDVAINNVGKVLKKPIVDISEEEYDSMFDANTKSAFFFLQEAGKKINKNGRIVMIVTSLLGAFTPFYSTYGGSKGAVEHFVRAAAKEFQDRQISVTCVAPGPMDTPFFYAQESKESTEYMKSVSLNGKLTDIKDIAPLVKFLVTDGWWITGTTIFANGGFTTR